MNVASVVTQKQNGNESSQTSQADGSRFFGGLGLRISILKRDSPKILGFLEVRLHVSIVSVEELVQSPCQPFGFHVEEIEHYSTCNFTVNTQVHWSRGRRGRTRQTLSLLGQEFGYFPKNESGCFVCKVNGASPTPPKRVGSVFSLEKKHAER